MLDLPENASHVGEIGAAVRAGRVRERGVGIGRGARERLAAGARALGVVEQRAIAARHLLRALGVERGAVGRLGRRRAARRRGFVRERRAREVLRDLLGRHGRRRRRAVVREPGGSGGSTAPPQSSGVSWPGSEVGIARSSTRGAAEEVGARERSRQRRDARAGPDWSPCPTRVAMRGAGRCPRPSEPTRRPPWSRSGRCRRR